MGIYEKIYGNPTELLIIGFTKPIQSLLLLAFTYYAVIQPNNFNAYVMFPFYLIGQLLWWGMLAAYGFDFIHGDAVKFVNEKAREIHSQPLTAKKAITKFLIPLAIVFLVIGLGIALMLSIEAVTNAIFWLIFRK